MMGWFRSALSAALLLCVLGGAAPATPFTTFNDVYAASNAYDKGYYEVALKLSRPHADQGNALAQANLGSMYENGLGVPQNYAEAVKWHRLAAAQGYARAQFNLGVVYDSGLGVPNDHAEAVKWYRLAAAQGYIAAQLSLGFEYMLRLNDLVSAHMWFNLAASRFYDSARETRDMAVKQRGLVAARMTPAQIAEAQQRASEWKPK